MTRGPPALAPFSARAIICQPLRHIEPTESGGGRRRARRLLIGVIAAGRQAIISAALSRFTLRISMTFCFMRELPAHRRHDRDTSPALPLAIPTFYRFDLIWTVSRQHTFSHEFDTSIHANRWARSLSRQPARGGSRAPPYNRLIISRERAASNFSA